MVWVVPLLTTELIPRSLTPAQRESGIRSLVGFGTVLAALALPVLYLRFCSCKAVPKDISGSTSYRRV